MSDFFSIAQQNMVKNQVMTNKVFDKQVWAAMSKVPRHEFISGKWQHVAYLDRDVPLGHDRFMLQPEVFAQLLQLAQIRAGDRVLDIGCGNGYSTAVIAEIAEQVVGVESARPLALHAAEILTKMAYKNIAVKHAELLGGAPEHAPYDVIVINGLVQKVPDTLLQQLRKNGRLVVVEKQGPLPKIVQYKNFGGTCAIADSIDGYATQL